VFLVGQLEVDMVGVLSENKDLHGRILKLDAVTYDDLKPQL